MFVYSTQTSETLSLYLYKHILYANPKTWLELLCIIIQSNFPLRQTLLQRLKVTLDPKISHFACSQTRVAAKVTLILQRYSNRSRIEGKKLQLRDQGVKDVFDLLCDNKQLRRRTICKKS